LIGCGAHWPFSEPAASIICNDVDGLVNNFGVRVGAAHYGGGFLTLS